MLTNRETLCAYLEADDWNNAFRLSQELGWNWIDIVNHEISARITEAHRAKELSQLDK